MAATKSWGQSAWTQWPAWGTVCIWARGKSRLISVWWLGLSVGEGRAEGVKVGGRRDTEKRKRAGRQEHMSPHAQGCFWILRHPLPTPKPSPRQDP